MKLTVYKTGTSTERFKQLRDLFNRGECFKLVCGAGNEDIEEVRRLATIYTLAGANMLDLSANVEVVRAAKRGVEKAYELSPVFGREIEIRPYLNVSIGMKGDPHVRKAVIDPNLCATCGECVNVCRQQAITGDLLVREYKCIGCGDCEKVCQSGAITFNHKKTDFENILPQCISEGVETMELHAVTEDEEGVFADWRLLNSMVRDNYISMCLDRKLLSNKRLIERIQRAYEVTGDRLIIQADGVPMGGEGDDYNTTLQAIACADVVSKYGPPVMILLSGGTNSRTGALARQCGVSANGVAIGSWARRIVRPFVSSENFDSDLEMVRKAVSIAEQLIKTNIEAIRGPSGN